MYIALFATRAAAVDLPWQRGESSPWCGIVAPPFWAHFQRSGLHWARWLTAWLQTWQWQHKMVRCSEGRKTSKHVGRINVGGFVLCWGNLYFSKACDLKEGKPRGLATEKLWLVHLDDDALALVFSLQCSWEEVYKSLCKTKASHQEQNCSYRMQVLKETQYKYKLWCDKSKGIFCTMYCHHV